ncbi:MAG: carbonic anhydrase [Sphingomicrobium sp.]
MSPNAIAIIALTAAMLAGQDAQHHWSYAGREGPSHWTSEFPTCGLGKAQSPINIMPSKVATRHLPALEFRYHPAQLRIVDNGHTIMVDYPPGSFLVVADHSYELVQFHFHKPSEETISGRHSAMVVHLVHKDARGHLAVVAILLETGAANQLVETLWRHVPQEKEHELEIRGVTIDANELLPRLRSYFTYQGSLTTPPCTEDVRWFVMKSAVTVSRREITTFGTLYRSNARPVQPLNRRKIAASN